ncbi:MAG: hypothetical protein HXS52_00780 [Theionarchaea archaeon]|nr:hypothetical protein [Theionarchaea archaeon]
MSEASTAVKIIRVGLVSVVVLLLLNSVMCGFLESSSEVQITHDENDQYAPRIFGSYVVWVDTRNGNRDIYGFNLETGEEVQITDDPNDQTNPEISGSYVVWVDTRNGNDDIYGFNLETGEEFRITWDSSNQNHPDISGTLVVWQDDRHYTNWEIYGYDLSRNEEIRITKNKYNQRWPRVSGDVVVWIDERNGKDVGYGCDLSDNREFRVCEDPRFDQIVPSGDRVVFLGRAHGDRLVGVYTVSTGSEIEIEIVYKCMEIDFEGNTIVWAETDFDSDSRPRSDLFGYDLATNRLLYISSSRETILHPAVYGDTVVWQCCRNGNCDIFCCSLEGIPFRTLSPRPPLEYYYGILAVLSVLGAFFLTGIHPLQRYIENTADKGLEIHEFRRSSTIFTIWFVSGALFMFCGFLEVYGRNHSAGFLYLIFPFLNLLVGFWFAKTPYFLITRNSITLFNTILKKPRVIPWDTIQNTRVNIQKKRVDLQISDDGIVRIELSFLDKAGKDALLRILPTFFPFANTPGE